MRIAVVIPHFRQAPFLAACLDSLLSQTRRPDEIIVVDSSAEDTRDIMPAYTAQGVTHIAQAPLGVAAARNAGIAAASSELISFLDADNLATPDRIVRQLHAFEQDRGVILCHGALVPIDRDGSRYDALPRYGSAPVSLERQLGWMLERNRIAADTVCVPRDEVLALGGFCETPGVREDYDLWLRMASSGRFHYINAPLALYRRHETNLSNNEAYMFEWEGGALRRVDWMQTRAALRAAFPEEEERLFVEGEVRLRRGELDRAERLFAALARRRQPALALFHLANIAITRNALGDAWMLLRRAIGEEPDDAGLLNNLGVVLARLGEGTLARDTFARALELNPLYQDAADNLAALARGVRPSELKVTRRRLRPQLMPMAAVSRTQPARPNPFGFIRTESF